MSLEDEYRKRNPLSVFLVVVLLYLGVLEKCAPSTVSCVFLLALPK